MCGNYTPAVLALNIAVRRGSVRALYVGYASPKFAPTRTHNHTCARARTSVTMRITHTRVRQNGNIAPTAAASKRAWCRQLRGCSAVNDTHATSQSARMPQPVLVTPRGGMQTARDGCMLFFFVCILVSTHRGLSHCESIRSKPSERHALAVGYRSTGCCDRVRGTRACVLACCARTELETARCCPCQWWHQRCCIRRWAFTLMGHA